jgi:hypothetical protein
MDTNEFKLKPSFFPVHSFEPTCLLDLDELIPNRKLTILKSESSSIDDFIDEISITTSTTLTSPGLEKKSQKFLKTIHRTKKTTFDLSIFDLPCKIKDFSYPDFYIELALKARKRLEKSKYLFPEPLAFLTSLDFFFSDSELDPLLKTKLKIRLAYALTKISLVNHGPAISSSMRKIMQASLVIQKKKITPKSSLLIDLIKSSLLEFLKVEKVHE